MTALAIVPAHNKRGLRDVTGAFLPEAKRFVKMHGGHIVQFNNNARNADRRAEVHEAIARGRHDMIAIFCHGWRTGIQTGHRIGDLDELAELMVKRSAHPRDIRVPLYCCSTAQGRTDGDGGFADELRDALCRAGSRYCRVWAHDSKGHTTRNARVRLFSGEGSPVGGVGGQWIVRPGSAQWRKWRRALRGDLRLRFPAMEIADIHRELSGDGLALA